MVSDRISIKGARVDSTTTSVSGEKFVIGGMEIVGDEGGDDILFSIRNDKKMVGA